MKKIILIDGNAIVHRAYHALPPFTTSKGELVNAVYGFTSMLLNIILHQKPDYLAVTFDKGKSFRHDEYKEYKATRVKAPDDLYAQFGRIKEILQALNVPVFEMEGYEADDLLGTLAKQLKEKGDLLTMIATGDKDALQLVNDRTQILMPHKGFKEAIIYDTKMVEEKMDLKPDQIADFKGLCGDTSDNIKGVPGIGEKTAIKLLKDFGSVEGIYEHLSEIKGAIHDKLEKGRKDAINSKHLATIVTEVPIKISLEECKTHTINQSAVRNLFEELEFKSLLRRLQEFNDKYREEIQLESGQQKLF